MDSSITAYMPGDILFYASGSGWGDTVISQWENSPIVHVAIATSAMFKIEALAGGIVKTPISRISVAKSYYFHQYASPVDAELLARALIWLDSQVGQMYGWGDIANAFLSKWEHGFSVDVGEHFDCSGLATEFLILTGGIQKLDGINPHEVTPSSLALLLLG